EQLGQNGLGALAAAAELGDVVAVLAVGGDDVIGRAQRRDGAHAHGFLADAEVEEAADFSLGVGLGGGLFGAPDEQHLAVQLEEQVALFGVGFFVAGQVHGEGSPRNLVGEYNGAGIAAVGLWPKRNISN